jgi:uncharacterized protein YaiE (UPF0345 family)
MKKLLRMTGRILVGVLVAGTLAFGTGQATASGTSTWEDCHQLNCVTQDWDFFMNCCGTTNGQTFCHRNSGVCVCAY